MHAAKYWRANRLRYRLILPERKTESARSEKRPLVSSEAQTKPVHAEKARALPG